MAAQDLPAVVTVTKMAEMCGLSRSRFYSLMAQGVFPSPVQTESSNRPVYVRDLIAQVLEIRRTGVSADGSFITFNEKRRVRQSQKCWRRGANSNTPQISKHSEIIAGLRSLGLDPTGNKVAELIDQEFPSGIGDLDPGEVIRQLFLLLKRRA